MSIAYYLGIAFGLFCISFVVGAGFACGVYVVVSLLAPWRRRLRRFLFGVD
jgi:hypothetical protein